MILQNIKTKYFFLSKSLEITSLILLFALLFTLLPNRVQAALGANAYQNGPNATATGQESIAIGNGTAANMPNSITIGYLSGSYIGSSIGQSSINIGAGAKGAAFSIAIGSSSAEGLQATSTGTRSRASDTYASAFGHSAFADHEGSVAIGTFAQPSDTYTVTVGSGVENQFHFNRPIINVADPINAHDAANKQYADRNSYDVSIQSNVIKNRINRIGAMQMSISNAQVDLADNKRTAVGIGMGTYHGSTATTMGITHRMPGRLSGLQFTGNFTIANAGDKAGGAGVGYAF